MTTGWTGGQYGLLRAVVGLTLAAHALTGVSRALEGPGGLAASALGVVASVALAIGWHDRVAALLLAFLWLLRMDPAPGLEVASTAVALLLVIHAAQAAAPYGSWDARGRIDPGGGWTFRPALGLAVWVLLAAAQMTAGLHAVRGTSSAFLLGAGVLQMAFGPLALVRSLRPSLWLVTFALHLGLYASGLSTPSLGIVLLFLYTFAPAWAPGRSPGAIETLFYDGTCGLCHRAVRFLLAEDPAGAAFRFAPLEGETFRARLSEAERASLPDSLALLTADGRVLTRSAGVRHLLERLGGLWRAIAAVAALVPFQDAAYDTLARIRHRLFARPKDACPILPAHLRARFLG